MVEINEVEKKTEKLMKRNEDNPRNLWDNVKCPNKWVDISFFIFPTQGWNSCLLGLAGRLFTN